MLARENLFTIEEVVNYSISMGGQLGQPWKIDDEVINIRILKSRLRQVVARLFDREYRKSADQLSELLDKIWVENHPHSLTANMDPIYGNPEYENLIKLHQESAERQLVAARKAKTILSDMQARLDVLEKYA